MTHTVHSEWVGIKLICCPLSWKHEWGLRIPNVKHRQFDIYSWSFAFLSPYFCNYLFS